jgi:GNAT superfamily N-acetyltransferase
MPPQEEIGRFSARRLSEADCDPFRSLRLQSLASCPAFMPLIEDHGDKLPLEIERSWPIDVWLALLRDNDERQFFGLSTGAELVGIGQLKRIDADIAELKSAFIKPAYRGRGLWKLLLNVRVDHAIRQKYKELRVGYRIGNKLMEHALQRTEFREIHREQMKNKYQDGIYGCRVVLSMSLSPGKSRPDAS